MRNNCLNSFDEKQSVLEIKILPFPFNFSFTAFAKYLLGIIPSTLYPAFNNFNASIKRNLVNY